MYNPQDSTITIKSTHVIKYLCQSFGVRNVRGQIPKSIYQASYFLPSDFSNNFPQACSHCKKLILKFHSNKKIQEDISKKYTVWRECKTLFFSHFLYHHWNWSSHSENMNWYFFDCNYFRQFFLPLLATKKLMTSASVW